MSITVTVGGNAPGVLGRVQEGLLDRARLHRAMAEGARVLVRHRFAELTKTNRNPWGKRSTFWPRMRRLTRAEATSEAGYVHMPREVAQRRFGGTIRPTGGRKRLAIPTHRNSYGKRPGEFDDLVLIKSRGGGGFRMWLVRKEGKATEILFRLVKSVNQKGDPDVLPTDAEFQEAAGSAAEALLRRLAA